MPIQEAKDKTTIRPGVIYVAPPNYHLLVEDDRTLALSIDPRVNFSRPAIDVLFESAVDVYAHHIIGVILTGGNHDGAHGLRRIKEAGGLTIVQDPKTAKAGMMPAAALAATAVDYVLPLPEIGALLARCGTRVNMTIRHNVAGRNTLSNLNDGDIYDRR